MLSPDQLNEQIAHAQQQIAGWQTKLAELEARQKAASAAAAYQKALEDGRTDDLPSLLAVLEDAHAAAFGKE